VLRLEGFGLVRVMFPVPEGAEDETARDRLLPVPGFERQLVWFSLKTARIAAGLMVGCGRESRRGVCGHSNRLPTGFAIVTSIQSDGSQSCLRGVRLDG
jgi:hypothetical protein